MKYNQKENMYFMFLKSLTDHSQKINTTYVSYPLSSNIMRLALIFLYIVLTHISELAYAMRVTLSNIQLMKPYLPYDTRN